MHRDKRITRTSAVMFAVGNGICFGVFDYSGYQRTRISRIIVGFKGLKSVALCFLVYSSSRMTQGNHMNGASTARSDFGRSPGLYQILGNGLPALSGVKRS